MRASVISLVVSGMVVAVGGLSPASATTVNFSFVGTPLSSTNSAGTASLQTLTGSISFSYTGSASNITLSDLTSFSATASLTSGSGTWTYSSVSDLSNFSYQNGTNQFLSFSTSAVPSSAGSNSAAGSSAGSMGSVSASLSDTGNNTVDLRNTNNDVLAFGSLVPAPEPANYGLLALGLIGLAVFGAVRSRRHFRGR